MFSTLAAFYGCHRYRIGIGLFLLHHQSRFLYFAFVRLAWVWLHVFQCEVIVDTANLCRQGMGFSCAIGSAIADAKRDVFVCTLAVGGPQRNGGVARHHTVNVGGTTGIMDAFQGNDQATGDSLPVHRNLPVLLQERLLPKFQVAFFLPGGFLPGGGDFVYFFWLTLGQERQSQEWIEQFNNNFIG